MILRVLNNMEGIKKKEYFICSNKYYSIQNKKAF